MKDAFWIFKSFGFLAGIRFVIGAAFLGIKRRLGLVKKPKRFEDLSLEEAGKEWDRMYETRTLH